MPWNQELFPQKHPAKHARPAVSSRSYAAGGAARDRVVVASLGNAPRWRALPLPFFPIPSHNNHTTTQVLTSSLRILHLHTHPNPVFRHGVHDRPPGSPLIYSVLFAHYRSGGVGPTSTAAKAQVPRTDSPDVGPNCQRHCCRMGVDPRVSPFFFIIRGVY